MRRAKVLIAFAILFSSILLLAQPAHAQINARMLRYPDVSDSHIAFVYAGDIWIVPKTGGTAQRLSTPSGEESFPRFSPDGSRIAFSGNYDGNTDIYVVAVGGGLVERLTHHPTSDRMLDWYPDGESILFATGMTSEKNRFNKLYRTTRHGGLPEKLPVPYGEFGAISPDGKVLAYIPISRDFRTWKRYRGGMAPEIWLFDLNDYSARNITHNVANDAHPMWHGSTLYFLSDRDANKRANIWAYDLQSEAVRQVTFFEDFDIRFPAIGPSDIVFEAGGRLYLLDLASDETHEVPITVVTDRATLKPRLEKVANLITSGDISPTGKRALFEARGDIFTVPAKHGLTRNLTRSSGAADRYPTWSPDGEQIAYFSDRTGEYELTVEAADGSGEPRTLTSLGAGFRYTPFWSPDSKKIAFIDQTMTIRNYDTESGELTKIDEGLWMYHGDLANFRVSWSTDSRWLAYSRGLPNRHEAVFLYDTHDGELHQVTSGFYGEYDPVFGPDGDFLFLKTNRNISPSYGDFQNSWVYANSTEIAAVPLRKDVPSPLLPRNDEEKVAGEEKNEESASTGAAQEPEAGGEEEEGAEEAEAVDIDLEGFESRLVVLPPEAGNYAELFATSGKVIYRRLPRTGSDDEDSPIAFFDLEAREEKTIIGDADGFEVSADGKKILLVSNDRFAIIDVAPGQKIESPMSTDGLEMTVDPVAEWRQIFSDVWRLQRDMFYDRNMHGVDWTAIGERYNSLIDDAVTRWDVNAIIGDLIAELNAGHTYRGGGDTETPERRGVGLLGVDFSIENGAYRIAKIIDGAPWDSEVRSPLKIPGVDVNEGDYLLAVNGMPIDTSEDPWAAFQGLADQVVELTVNDRPTLDDARTVLVKTLGSEYRLRNLAWINDNRKRVEEATGGRVGYVYVPDTSINGQNELLRQFVAQIDKQGLIIDERFNSGGQIPDRFVELLNRPIYNYWGVRDGKDWQWPPIAHFGPKVMLINHWSGSGGDAFPFYFREAGVGPLIGTRTWGGLIGITGAPQLIDGGFVTVPTFGIYSTDGKWIIESHGVDPDIEVIADPSAMAKGHDPQLERAIQEVTHMLAENPPVRPKRPKAANRSGH
ncbi:MAG: PDZ domain-containing protein [Acidobacteriota bacterium]